jgi:hypothetical protein
LLYHGCGNVGDVRGATALAEAARMTCATASWPAALATRDPVIAKTRRPRFWAGLFPRA